MISGWSTELTAAAGVRRVHAPVLVLHLLRVPVISGDHQHVAIRRARLLDSPDLLVWKMRRF